MIHAHMLYGYSPIQTLKNGICYLIPVNTKHLYNICRMLDQRRRRWADVVQMLYKCFVFAGMHNYCFITYVKKAMFLVMFVCWFFSGQGIIHFNIDEDPDYDTDSQSTFFSIRVSRAKE